MDCLDGLEKLGLKDLEGMGLYEGATQKVEAAPVKKAASTDKSDEASMLFRKSCTCVICDKQFKALTVKSGKARLVDADRDLRPHYADIEPLKYDVISCPYCGFSAVSRFFVPMAPSQKKNIVEKICSKVTPFEDNKDVYTYEDAMDRYKLALVNSVVKVSKSSEKAFTCLKAGWLIRSYVEELGGIRTPKVVALLDEEDKYMRNAYDGFVRAVANEPFPICGMDEQTVNYLLGVLAMRYGDYTVSKKLISTVLTSKNSSNRLKDKALLIKDELLQIKQI